MQMILNIPNSMSLLRILMVPILFLLITNFSPKNYSILIIVYFFTVLLDFTDGFIARKFGQETELGKILDPLADKLLIVALVVAFIIKSHFPIWLAVSIFIRDLCILLGSIIVYKKSHSVKPSIIIGKVTFAGMSVLILFYVIDLNPSVDLEILKKYAIALVFSFLLWSFEEYYKIYKDIKNGRAKKHSDR
jgi:CDP-diacylglycerol--glycerol-3-phosphate 3-phosphatidyltransferase